MPCEVLVKATENLPWKKGYIVEIRDSVDLISRAWGGKETLPDFVRIEITDASKVQVENYLDQLANDISYEILGENALGYRIRMSVPNYIAMQFNDKALKKAIRDHVIDAYDATVFAHDSVNAEWATFDIPKPFDLQDAKEDMLDRFKELVDVNRYYFSASDVDTTISMGGTRSINKAQAQNAIIDKLE